MDHLAFVLASDSSWFGRIGGYLWSVASTTFLELLAFLGPLMLLAAIMHQISRRVELAAARLMGQGRLLHWFRAVGVAVHELGHAGMCLLFRHRIVKIQLFTPDPDSGTLGYVQHAYNPNSIYQRAGNFFIGIGPIFSGSIVIALALHLLLGDRVGDLLATPAAPDASSVSGIVLELASMSLSTAASFLSGLASLSTLTDWRFWLFLYLAMTVGGHISLSRPDLEGARSGLEVLVGALLVANALILLFLDLPPADIVAAGVSAIPLYSILVISLVVNLIMLVLLGLLVRVFGSRF